MGSTRRTAVRTTGNGRSGNAGRQPALPPPPACTPATLPPHSPKQMLKAGDERFRRETAELASRRLRIAGDLLQFRYDLGGMAARIVNEAKGSLSKRHYGCQTVSDLAKALGENRRTLYICIAFREQTTPERRSELKKKQYPWRAVAALTTVRDVEARKQIAQRFEAKEFETGSEVRRAVAAANAETRRKENSRKPARRSSFPGEAQAFSMLRSFNTVMGGVLETLLPRAIEAAEDYAWRKHIFSPATRPSLESELRRSLSHVSGMNMLLFQLKKVIADLEALFPGRDAGSAAEDVGGTDPGDQDPRS